MTYEEFKTHILTFSWREADPDLTAALDGIILMADAYLNTHLEVQDRSASATLSVVPNGSLDIDLPSDYFGFRDLIGESLNRGEFTYTTPAELRWQREATKNSDWMPLFSLEGRKLMLVGPTANLTEAQPIIVSYWQTVPKFQTAGTSWLIDYYLDIYTYATLMQVGVWAREDERIAQYAGLLTDAVTTAVNYSKMYKERGKIGDLPLPTVAGIRHPGLSTRHRHSYKTRGNT